MSGVAEAAKALLAGGIVCVPTESTFGLAVDPRQPEAVDRLVALKGRGEAAIALIAANAEQAKAFARVWPDSATQLAAAHWPGPLTLVVPAKEEVHRALVGPSGGFGVRVSSHPLARQLAAQCGTAVTATSANPSGQPAATTVDQARDYFGDRVAAYLDDGQTHQATPSTVLDVGADGSLTELRAGPIDWRKSE